jgi:hypothetical protein
VIAVEMAEKNRVEAEGVDTCPFHSQQRRWTAIHKEKAVFGFDKISALIAPATAKGVATAENV